MKKLIFLLLTTISLGLNAQVYEWTPSVNIATMVRTDTVLQPTRDVLPDIIGYNWSVTVYTTNLDSAVTVNFGGSNNIVSAKSLRGFEAFTSSSLPFTFSKVACRVITNNDTTYQKTFTGGENPFPFARPQLKLTKTTADAGTVYFKFLFFEE
jgi:hypothetical protein